MIDAQADKATQNPLCDDVLQVILTDNLSKEKCRVATQAMDFEVRKPDLPAPAQRP